MLIPSTLALLRSHSTGNYQPIVIDRRGPAPEPAPSADGEPPRVCVLATFSFPGDVAAALDSFAQIPPKRPRFDLLHVGSSVLLDVEGPILTVLQSPAGVKPPISAVLFDGGPPKPLPNPPKLCTEGLHMALTPAQQNALRTCLAEDVTLLTGAPGTGKSTVLCELVCSLKAAADASGVVQPTILVAFHCNHSLDTFLHRLLKHGFPVRSLARIGGQCVDPLIESRSLFAHRTWGKRGGTATQMIAPVARARLPALHHRAHDAAAAAHAALQDAIGKVRALPPLCTGCRTR